MIDGIIWFFSNLGMAFVNLAYALTHPGQWLAWLADVCWFSWFRDSCPQLSATSKEPLARFIYYGASTEFFFVVFTAFLVLTGFGIWRRAIMWRAVRVLEGFANGLGRFFAWAGLLMVLQQIMIIFLQRIFRVSEIGIGPEGFRFARDLSWWSEELKLYNAIIICLCISYTFVQGGHVRVDLIYSAVRYRTKKLIDMAGALFFMMPMAVLMWLYAWFFMWRHMVVPNPNAALTLDRIMAQSRALRWNLETTSFSPNGFDAYYLFKVLMVLLAGMIFIHAIAVFYRAYLNFIEGEASEGKFLDKDTLDAGPDAPQSTN